jgi:ATP adenylyltransferase
MATSGKARYDSCQATLQSPYKAPCFLFIDTKDDSAMSARLGTRFHWVTSGLKSGPLYPFDLELLGSPEAAVTPTLGSIVPGWVLVIPRQAYFSFANIAESHRRRIGHLVDRVRFEMAAFEGKVFFFEHGARKSESAVGCGVDQAHLHVVSLQTDLLASALTSNDGMSWIQADPENPWASIPIDQEYYLISDFNRAYVGYSRKPISQYFRKLIARDTGHPEEWDYRRYQHERNARQTIRAFNGLGEKRFVA